MLSRDHLQNLRMRSDAVASSVHRAWAHFQLLRALREVAVNDPQLAARHHSALSAIYCAAFDALYVVVGQVTDSTRNSESLHTLVRSARSYRVERSVVVRLDQILASTRPDDGSPLYRLSRWRHEFIAHRTRAALNSEFYEANRLHLDEIEEALEVLDTALSDMAEILLKFRYDHRSSTEPIFRSCLSLLAQNSPG